MLPVAAGGGAIGLLLGGALTEPVLCRCEAMGREEGPAPPDAREESSGLRLEEVEYGVAL